MIETKKFIFLSSRQRRWVSWLLGLLLLLSIVLLVTFSKFYQDAEIKTLSIDLVKLLVTAWGAWGLILLYASSNSYNRINTETMAFMEVDIPRAFSSAKVQRGDRPMDPVDEGLALDIVVNTNQATVYRFSDSAGFNIHFYCRSNIYEMVVMLYLPAEPAEKSDDIYKTSLAYLRDSNVKVSPMGVYEMNWTDTPEKRLVFQIIRPAGEDFLFDAAKRAYLANCIYGDVRAFFLRARKAFLQPS